MNKQVVEERFLEAVQLLLPSGGVWETQSFRLSENEDEASFPMLSSEVEDIQLVGGKGRLGTVIGKINLLSMVGGPGEPEALKHAERVKMLCRLFDSRGQEFLVTLNEKASPDFQCRGFSEAPPSYGQEGPMWTAGIRVQMGIEWQAA